MYESACHGLSRRIYYWISCVVIVLTLAPVTVLSPLVLESKTVWYAVTAKRCARATKFPVKREWSDVIILFYDNNKDSDATDYSLAKIF